MDRNNFSSESDDIRLSQHDCVRSHTRRSILYSIQPPGNLQVYSDGKRSSNWTLRETNHSNSGPTGPHTSDNYTSSASSSSDDGPVAFINKEENTNQNGQNLSGISSSTSDGDMEYDNKNEINKYRDGAHPFNTSTLIAGAVPMRNTNLNRRQNHEHRNQVAQSSSSDLSDPHNRETPLKQKKRSQRPSVTRVTTDGSRAPTLVNCTFNFIVPYNGVQDGNRKGKKPSEDPIRQSIAQLNTLLSGIGHHEESESVVVEEQDDGANPMASGTSTRGRSFKIMSSRFSSKKFARRGSGKKRHNLLSGKRATVRSTKLRQKSGHIRGNSRRGSDSSLSNASTTNEGSMLSDVNAPLTSFENGTHFGRQQCATSSKSVSFKTGPFKTEAPHVLNLGDKNVSLKSENSSERGKGILKSAKGHENFSLASDTEVKQVFSVHPEDQDIRSHEFSFTVGKQSHDVESDEMPGDKRFINESYPEAYTKHKDAKDFMIAHDECGYSTINDLNLTTQFSSETDQLKNNTDTEHKSEAKIYDILDESKIPRESVKNKKEKVYQRLKHTPLSLFKRRVNRSKWEKKPINSNKADQIHDENDSSNVYDTVTFHANDDEDMSTLVKTIVDDNPQMSRQADFNDPSYIDSKTQAEMAPGYLVLGNQTHLTSDSDDGDESDYENNDYLKAVQL